MQKNQSTLDKRFQDLWLDRIFGWTIKTLLSQA